MPSKVGKLQLLIDLLFYLEIFILKWLSLEHWEPIWLIQGSKTLLTEVSVLAEGSLAGFMKGNRCTRIHQILAAVMERTLFERYMDLLSDEEASFIKKVMDDSDSTLGHCQTVIENALFKVIMKKYETFFHSVMDGQYGSTAAYWAIYVYFINRLYRELQNAVCINSVDGYIQALPSIIEAFFALNRPNYARWVPSFSTNSDRWTP